MRMNSHLKPLIRFFEHLPRNGDVEFAILKTHLLIEELLAMIISRAAKDPSAIEEANLGFAQKMQLARAFSNLGREAWLWEALQALNQTRNKLAHRLSATEIQQRCDAFIELVERSQDIPTDEILSPTFGRFHWAAFKVFSALASYANFDASALRKPTFLTGSAEPRASSDG